MKHPEHTTDKLPEQLGEILEILWALEERGQEASEEVLRESAQEACTDLLEALRCQDLVTIDGARRIRLAKGGRRLAEQIIRRHRLAERLICDVLGAHVDESEHAACEFEHILAEGITASICTLLGHPRRCPHGRQIPQGECCRTAEAELHPILVSSDQLNVGESATIAYLAAREHTRMLRLSALGIVPGNQLKLLQKWPSCVLQCDELEIAVEEDVARSIYVRRRA